MVLFVSVLFSLSQSTFHFILKFLYIQIKITRNNKRLEMSEKLKMSKERKFFKQETLSLIEFMCVFLPLSFCEVCAPNAISIMLSKFLFLKQVFELNSSLCNLISVCTGRSTNK